MNITAWSQLTTQGRIDAIRSVWQPGMSAANIASHFDGVSRNAIIGMFHRHADKMADMRLGAVGDNGQNNPRRKGKASNNLAWRMQREASLRVVKPEPEPAIDRATFGAVQTVGIPLAMFNGHRCKWCINDPEQGANEHLFCGEVTKEGRPYCAYHATRAVGQGTESERSADRAPRSIAQQAA